MTTEIIYEMPNSDYHARPELSSSGLKKLQRSPLHFWAAHIDPEREPTEETPAMMLGTATHTAFLEPGEFDARYIVAPEGLTKQSKDGKAFYDDAEAAGLIVLKPDDHKRIKKMAAIMRQNPIIRIIFEQCNPVFEASIFFERNGVKCRIRPDLFVEPCDHFPAGLVLDAKTTTDASPEGFAKRAWDLSYHLSADFYSDGFRRHFRTEKNPVFALLSVESEAPHAVGIYTIPDDLAKYSRLENNRLIGIYAECMAKNEWPGYSTKAQPLAMPAWAQKAINETVEG